MTRPTTETLEKEIKELVKTHNDALKIQQDARQRIIEIQAVLKDRAYEDTNDSNSTDSTD